MSTPPPPIVPPPDAPKLFKEIAPAELHDRGWAKPYLDKPWTAETQAEILKKLDGAETLLGKPKLLLPGDGAKSGDWDSVFEKLRPAKAEDYGYDFGEKADKDFAKTFLEASHHAGLNKEQLDRQLGKLRPFFEAREKAARDAVVARDADYEKTLKEMTGGADFAAKQARVQNATRELVPEAARQYVDKLKDGDLALFTVFANSLLEKYAGEDEFKGNEGGNNGGGGGQDKDALVKELTTLYASEGWTKGFSHPDHDKTKKRVDEILAHPALK